jgi:recombination endonuclease VII
MVSKVYGLDPGEYALLYRFQGGVCAGCRRATGTGKRKLAVDHNHETGEPRGLLCYTCNQVVGHFRDDPEALRRLAQYLENPPRRRMREPKNANVLEGIDQNSV